MCRNFHHSKDLDPHQDLGVIGSQHSRKVQFLSWRGRHWAAACVRACGSHTVAVEGVVAGGPTGHGWVFFPLLARVSRP